MFQLRADTRLSNHLLKKLDVTFGRSGLGRPQGGIFLGKKDARPTLARETRDLSNKTRDMLGTTSWIKQALPELSDRETLYDRIAKKLSGARRGSLKLPPHFPKEVHALSNLTNSYLRDSVFTCSRLIRAELFINDKLFNYVHSVLPDGRIRTVNRNYPVHLSQVAEVRPLAKQDWPRLGSKLAWPSSPTISESLAMAFAGKTPKPFNKYTYTPQWRISACQLSRDTELAKRIVSRQIVGIRSDVRIPRKFLGFFRYRWDFLILSGSWSLPSGLARFLLAQWKTNPHSLWLKDKCYLKTFLRSTSSTIFNCSVVGPW